MTRLLNREAKGEGLNMNEEKTKLVWFGRGVNN